MAERRHLGLKFIGTGFYSVEFLPKDYWPGELSAAERKRAVESGLYQEQEYPSDMPPAVASITDATNRSTQEVTADGN